MADPVTWAVVLSASAATVSAVGAIKQGQAQAAAANYNAELAQQNANSITQQGQAASEAQQHDTMRKMGAAVAAYGASGVEGDTGSPTDVLADNVRTATLNNLTLQYDYKLKALGFQDKVGLDQANASNSISGSYLSAAGSLLNGGSKAASMGGLKFGGGGDGTPYGGDFSGYGTGGYAGT